MKITPRGLHHVAWRCIDAEQTRHFYEDILGFPLIHVIKADIVPSTQEEAPYVHLFFELGDGSCVAFFDVGDGKGHTLHPSMPSWIHHFAMELASSDELMAMKRRLIDEGVEVIGPVDHHFVTSIYFFDPNGIRLEFTVRCDLPGYLDEARRTARSMLDAWTRSKQSSRHPD